MPNYATKADLKNATGVNASFFAKTVDLPNWKSDVDKLDIDKLKDIPTTLNNLKSQVDKLDIGKLETALIDLSKLSDVVKNDVAKNDVYNAKKKILKMKYLILLM